MASGKLRDTPSCRHLTSIEPSFSPRSPMTTRSGTPIRSTSLNFTPGRWSRSSVSTSTPAASSSCSSFPVRLHDFRLVHLERNQRHLVGRQGQRPDDPVVVMAGFDGRRP